jgi:hypothetical protein
MGLFSKPKGIGEKHKCAYCGKALYELTEKNNMEVSMDLLKKGYQWDTMMQCPACKATICQNCMRFRFRMPCSCGSQVYAIPVATK